MTETSTKPGTRVIILNGVDHYHVMEPMYEGIRVVLTYRGESYSPAYIQGVAGAAFRIAGICPCAPTCSTAISSQTLVTQLGYQAESMPLDGEGDLREARLQTLLARVKDEIRAGRPVVLWHAFTTAEWDVVCGFDDETHEFYGRGSYAGRDGYAHASEMRTITCLDICPALGAIFIGEKVSAFDARAAELAALREAVHHAHTTKDVPAQCGQWSFLEGLQSYDRWVQDYACDPHKRRGPGDAYCIGIYRSTHRAAADFLCELSSSYPRASAHLLNAAARFTAEAVALDQCEPLLGWQSPEGPDTDRKARAALLLGQARDSYARGIASIEQALSVIGSD